MCRLQRAELNTKHIGSGRSKRIVLDLNFTFLVANKELKFQYRELSYDAPQEGRKKRRKEGKKEGRKEGRKGGRREGKEEGREGGRKEGREGGRKEGTVLGPVLFLLHVHDIKRVICQCRQHYHTIIIWGSPSKEYLKFGKGNAQVRIWWILKKLSTQSGLHVK